MHELEPLNEIEARILGCLIEKERSTPEYYPLTLNNLLVACNQKSNRNPVMQLDEFELEEALDQLREKKWVFRVDTAGSRVAKFRHDLAQKIELYGDEIAIICILLLRGPQTIGEIRSRTERISNFESIKEVLTTLEDLKEEDRFPTILKLSVQPGQKEVRYTHLLCGMPNLVSKQEEKNAFSRVLTKGQEREEDLINSIRSLEGKVEKLEMNLDFFQKEFCKFKEQFE